MIPSWGQVAILLLVINFNYVLCRMKLAAQQSKQQSHLSLQQYKMLTGAYWKPQFGYHFVLRTGSLPVMLRHLYAYAGKLLDSQHVQMHVR